MQAGQLNNPITLQQPSVAVDALGQRVETWVNVDTVWARAQPVRGREYFAAGQVQSETAVKFTIRWRADVSGAMRVLWRGLAHAIVAEPIDVDGRRVALELMCAAGIRDGNTTTLLTLDGATVLDGGQDLDAYRAT
jgi:SPP1 family predicted phage head-tail adaptor